MGTLDAFLDVPADEILRRVREAASSAAGGPREVRVGPEHQCFRNIGIDLPRARRSRLESRNMRLRIWYALEAIGVTMAHAAHVPRVFGDLEGQVQVRAMEPRMYDDVAAPPPKVPHVVGR